MKINQDLRLNLDKVHTDQKQVLGNGAKFANLVQKQDQKMQMSQLQVLLKDIDLAGQGHLGI